MRRSDGAAGAWWSWAGRLGRGVFCGIVGISFSPAGLFLTSLASSLAPFPPAHARSSYLLYIPAFLPQLDLSPYPNVQKYMARLAERPACAGEPRRFCLEWNRK